MNLTFQKFVCEINQSPCQQRHGNRKRCESHDYPGKPKLKMNSMDYARKVELSVHVLLANSSEKSRAIKFWVNSNIHMVIKSVSTTRLIKSDLCTQMHEPCHVCQWQLIPATKTENSKINLIISTSNEIYPEQYHFQRRN